MAISSGAVPGRRPLKSVFPLRNIYSCPLAILILTTHGIVKVELHRAHERIRRDRRHMSHVPPDGPTERDRPDYK